MSGVGGEPAFPVKELARLDELINRPRWVVPVLPKGELEVLLDASIKLCKKGLDTRSDPCQRFFREGLTTSFCKIMTEEAVGNWKYEIQKCILKNAEKLVELCVAKLYQDWFPLLDLLAMVFSPHCKFHTYNGTRPSETVSTGSSFLASGILFARPCDTKIPRGWLVDLLNKFGQLGGFQFLLNRFTSEPPLTVPVIAALVNYKVGMRFCKEESVSPSCLLDKIAECFGFHTYNGTRPSETVSTGSSFLASGILFARPCDTKIPRGWLVDLLNKFGQLGGFQFLLNRFTSEPPLTVPVIAALVKPFGQCAELLTQHTVQKYLVPVVEITQKFLNGLSDEELKKSCEMKNNGILLIVTTLKQMVYSSEVTPVALEELRLKMILRLLKIQSYRCSFSAVDEVNKMIENVTAETSRQPLGVENELLTAKQVAEWLQENDVIPLVLRDNLHVPGYVGKLGKIYRFMIKEKSLTLQNLDDLWKAQAAARDAVVKNIHDLLAKLAHDFSSEQFDRLLEYLKALQLLWDLAHYEDIPTDILEQTLRTQIKILDSSSTQDRDAQKMSWITKFVEELKNDQWVLPALKQIREICQLFPEPPENFPHVPNRVSQVYYRNSVISVLQSNHSIVMLVAQNLSAYMNKARQYAKDHPNVDPGNILPDGRFSHVEQVQERLRFLRFLLKVGQLWLCESQATQIWHCLAENAIYLTDREACFKWFAKMMGDEPDLDPEITKEFFEKNLLQFDASLLTENGMTCFERFFMHVNMEENKLIQEIQGGFMMDDLDLIGYDYLWKVTMEAPDDVAENAIELLKDTSTNLGPRLHQNQKKIREDFIQTTVDRLEALYNTVTILEKDKDSSNRMMQETTRMIRALTVLKEYVTECVEAHGEERSILPLSRACRGKVVTLVVRFPNQGRQVDDIDIWSHTNDTIGAVRRHILHRVKASSNVKVDLYVNGEILDPSEDKRVISQIPLRDKMLITAKLVNVGSSIPSSPDSNSDSSGGAPHHTFDGPNIEAEKHLPGVLMSNNQRYAQYWISLSDLGCSLQATKLRDTARDLLKLMPADSHTVDKFRTICSEHVRSDATGMSRDLEAMFFNSSPTQVLYNIEVVYSLLMPSLDPMADDAFEFQYNFIRSGGVQLALDMLTKQSFLPNTDIPTRRAAYVTVLKICKLMLTTVGYAKLQVVVDACSTESRGPPITAAEHSHAVVLQQALHHIPNPSTELTTRNIALKLGQKLADKATSVVPDLNTIKAIQKIAWASGSCSLHLANASNDDIHKAHEKPKDSQPETEDPSVAEKLWKYWQHSKDSQPELEDLSVAREAMEVLTVCMLLCPSATDVLHKDKAWQSFIIDILLRCKHKPVRQVASEQFFLMAAKCTSSNRPVVFFITLLFTVLSTLAKENAKQAHEYFCLLCSQKWNVSLKSLRKTQHLNKIFSMGRLSFQQILDVLVQLELGLRLKKAQEQVKKTTENHLEETLLAGHLGITTELLAFQSADKKCHIGSEKGGANLIKEILEDFVFPASTIVLMSRKLTNREFPTEQAVPVCTSSGTVNAAYDLLVALCTGCVPNLKTLTSMLIDMFYTADAPPTEWEYMPPVGPRPQHGLVGLGGYQAYAHVILQQLFLIEPIRTEVLAVDAVPGDIEEDITAVGVEGRVKVCEVMHWKNKKVQVGNYQEKAQSERNSHTETEAGKTKLTIRLWDEPIDKIEPHDALEFYNCLIDSLDEAFKALEQQSIVHNFLGGSFADQKICKDCPHRYERKEPFTSLTVDTRNRQNLYESLDEYVKGNLLEGANAYHCERCNKKVDAVRRLVIRDLPKVLVIQLKRFDYDWERERCVKFNDYYEFPRKLDMEPYTAQGLAKLEGEMRDIDGEEKGQSTKYKLIGAVIHKGDASGGQYYSFALHQPDNEAPKWYKFADDDVSECQLEDDEELKNQCFGGDYMEEVFDRSLQRLTYRRREKFWNAYIVFYEKLDASGEVETVSQATQELAIGNKPYPIKMPLAIEKSVRKQNIMFMHKAAQFCPEYFQFMKRLLTCNQIYTYGQQDKLYPEGEQLAMLSTELASKFLFTVGFHTKKTLRGSANEWYEALTCNLRSSKNVRMWFAQNVLFAQPGRFGEYLLECPSSEVRSAFCKVVVCLAQFSLNDGLCPPPLVHGRYAGQSADPNATLSDHLLLSVLQLLKKEVSEHGRHLQQYFHLFLMYSNLGVAEKMHLLKLNVPAHFMTVALDEGPGPPIKYQYAEISKLYSVVSQLVRCCDISSKCMPYKENVQQNQAVLPNPYGDQILMPIQLQVAEILIGRTSYVKKVLEDFYSNRLEDTTKLLQYCCWENPHFSSTVLSELLWQVANSHTYELRPYLDLLLQMLLLEDSWQKHRIHNALKGIPDDRDGLLVIIQKSKSQYQKRAYQCIKMMVELFMHCQPAAQILQNNEDLKRKWTLAIEWLQGKLEVGTAQTDSSLPAQSNDSSPPAQAGDTSAPEQHDHTSSPEKLDHTSPPEQLDNTSPPTQSDVSSPPTQSAYRPSAMSNETSNGYFLERSESARVTLAKAVELRTKIMGRSDTKL